MRVDVYGGRWASGLLLRWPGNTYDSVSAWPSFRAGLGSRVPESVRARQRIEQDASCRDANPIPRERPGGRFPTAAAATRAMACTDPTESGFVFVLFFLYVST